jgi:hypothetical protein
MSHEMPLRKQAGSPREMVTLRCKFDSANRVENPYRLLAWDW